MYALDPDYLLLYDLSDNIPFLTLIDVLNSVNYFQELFINDICDLMFNQVFNDRRLQAQVSEMFAMQTMCQLLEMAVFYQVLDFRFKVNIWGIKNVAL